MKVLITGGAGFVGSHLAEALLERDDEVFVIDDLSNGKYREHRAFEVARAISLHHRHDHERTGSRGDGGSGRRDFPSWRPPWV